MAPKITPRTLKGFRDYLPETMIPRRRLIDTAARVYQSYGFSPIDTPALEYLDILTGKGSDETDKQMYRFTDSGGRDVGSTFFPAGAATCWATARNTSWRPCRNRSQR